MKKSQNMGDTAMQTFDEIVMELINMTGKLILISGIGIAEIVKLTYRHILLAILTFFSIHIVINFIIENYYHLKLIYLMFPEFMTFERIKFVYLLPSDLLYFTFLTIIIVIGSIPLGWRVNHLREKFINIFTTIGLKNSEGKTPKLIKTIKLDKYRKQYEFDSNSIGISEFSEKQERIEASFSMEVESIKVGKNPSRVLVTFSSQKFPTSVTYQELSENKVLPPDSFYVGQSHEGIVTQKISELPHLLIAGTTGSGKSVFFKQCLLGLLESSKNVQLYIVDLKGGLEAIDFKESPNVRIIKTMNDAVTTMRFIEKEMKERFSFLEANGLKAIEPSRDKKDRIVLAVDEASILYMNRNRYDDDYQKAIEARKLADSISKLSRAAAIHLVLATQKLDKQIIPTSVSENISGRMAFRANSLQGSLVVLGTKDASELPEIAGRGIWNVASKKQIIQSPFITDKEIKQVCKRIKNESEAKKILQSEMCGEKEAREAKEVDDAIEGALNEKYKQE